MKFIALRKQNKWKKSRKSSSITKTISEIIFDMIVYNL